MGWDDIVEEPKKTEGKKPDPWSDVDKPGFFKGAEKTLGPDKARQKEQLESFGDMSQTPEAFKLYLKGMGYPWGIVKTSAADILKRAANGADFFKPESGISRKAIDAASSGESLPLNELLKESFPDSAITKTAADVLPIKKDSFFDVSPVNAAEFLLATKLDPLARIRSELSLAGVNPKTVATGDIGERVGYDIYKSPAAQREADLIALEKGSKIAPSRVGFEGGARTLKEQRTGLLRGLKNKVRGIEGQIVGEADIDRTLAPAIAKSNELRASGVPSNIDIADNLDYEINRIKESMGKKAEVPAIPGTPPTPAKTVDILGIDEETSSPMVKTITIDEAKPGIPGVPAIPARPGPSASQIKELKLSKSQGKPGSSMYGQFEFSPQGKRASDTIRYGAKKELETMAENTQPGLGAELTETNAREGALLNAKSVLKKEDLKYLRKNAITPMDIITGATVSGMSSLGHSLHGGMPSIRDLLVGAGSVGAKKGVEYFNRPNTRMGLGLTVKDISQNSIWEEMIRRGLINSLP